MSNALSTEVFVIEHLSDMVNVDPSDAIIAYQEYNQQVTAAMGDVLVPGVSNFDWDLLGEITNGVNQDQGEASALSASTAGRTAIMAMAYCRGVGSLITFPVHTGPGTFITVDSMGRPRAFAHELNPAVPLEYGCIDGAALRKVGQAVLIEKLCRQGADWGTGYTVLQAINKSLGLIGPTGEQTIGMATLHAVSYSGKTAGANRRPLAFSGTAGRTASELFLKYLRLQPDFASRMDMAENEPDRMAGLLDSLSSSVANQAAITGVLPTTHIVKLPDPRSRDNIGVNWN